MFFEFVSYRFFFFCRLENCLCILYLRFIVCSICFCLKVIGFVILIVRSGESLVILDDGVESYVLCFCFVECLVCEVFLGIWVCFVCFFYAWSFGCIKFVGLNFCRFRLEGGYFLWSFIVFIVCKLLW